MKFTKTFAILLTILLFTNPAFSKMLDLPTFKMEESKEDQDTSSIVESLIQHAEDMVLKGDTEAAISSFSQALLLDLYSKSAQIALSNIAHTKNIKANTKATLFLLEDLFSMTDNLLKKVGYYANKNRELKRRLVSLGYKSDDIKENMLKIKMQTISSSSKPSYRWQSEFLYNKDTLVILNDILRQEKNDLSVELDYLKEQNVALKKIQEKGRVREAFLNKAQLSAYQRAAIKKKEDMTDVYRRQFSLVREHMDNLKSEVFLKEKRVEKLARSLMDTALRLTEKEMRLRERMEQISLLNGRLQELESRFELGQKIMKDKDKKISSTREDLELLKKRVVEQREELALILSSKDDKLIELNGILQIYKGKLGDVSKGIKEKIVNIKILEEQLSFVRKRLFEKDKSLDKTSDALDDLEKEIEEVQRKYN
ncbi:MAG: hypothetical protein P9X22_06585 [Candidatus Zapsychrus exili]|nr:hypothetical protein [Candidatus Zapsychrus exili]